MTLTNQVFQIIETLEIIPEHWKIVPNLGKTPLGYRWNEDPSTPDSIQHQLQHRGRVRVKGRNQKYYQTIPSGISLICGEQFNGEFIVAVDFDGKSAYERIEKMGVCIPQTVAFTSGRSHRAQYLFKIPDPGIFNNLKSSALTTAEGEYLEFRSNLPSVLPPSIHPDTGKRYYWLDGCNPSDMVIAHAPEWVIEQMMRPVVHQHCWSASDVDIEEVVLILHKIHPRFADNYYSWIKIGTALKSASENLLSEWEQWSRTSSKYKAGECAYKWKSFRPVVGVRTLYYYASIS